jgi:ParB family chromosome partitioning protein
MKKGESQMFISKKGEPSFIDVESVNVNPNQPRTDFEDEVLDELTDSIKEFGIIQPLIVKKISKEKYELIAGERRLRAAVRAGLTSVPVIIREADDQESALIALIENVQRENLSFLEEAKAYKRLIDEHGLTQTLIAQKVGKKQSTISNKLRLLTLPEDIQISISKNKLTERHARALLKIDDEEIRRYVIDRIVKNKLNVTQTEKLVTDLMNKHENIKKNKERIHFINYRIYVNTVKKAFECIFESEKNAQYFQEDKGDMVEMRILIPKKA